MKGGITYNFQNKIAFITGASTGIGRATALAFAKHGAGVAVVDVNTDAGAQTAHLIEKEGGRSLFLKCDVSKGLVHLNSHLSQVTLSSSMAVG